MNVFISYSHVDEPLARKMAAALQSNGLKVWGDQVEILPGDNWAEKVAEALRLVCCRAFAECRQVNMGQKRAIVCFAAKSS